MRVPYQIIFAVIVSAFRAEDIVAKEDSVQQNELSKEQENQHPDNERHHVARKALISGRYRAGEIVSKQTWFQPGQRLRVEWVAKPAVGNCVISLFSIFNADLLFDYSIPESQRPAWSEIAIETFGGSASRTHRKQFQTQYISQNDPNAPPTQRGMQHYVNHFLGDGNIVNIFDGQFHTFEIEFQAAGGSYNVDAEIIYRLDGFEIRRVLGGDANFLEPPLDIYAGVWASSTQNDWACTADQTNPAVSRRLQTVTEFPLNINCGGPALGSFSADSYFLSGNKYALKGCRDPSCSERWGPVRYEIPVPNGEYT